MYHKVTLKIGKLALYFPQVNKYYNLEKSSG